jgi:predicted kinase
MSVGSGRTRLIVLRGNSGSGKSTVARALCDAYGRGAAWVSANPWRVPITTDVFARFRLAV